MFTEQYMKNGVAARAPSPPRRRSPSACSHCMHFVCITQSSGCTLSLCWSVMFIGLGFVGRRMSAARVRMASDGPPCQPSALALTPYRPGFLPLSTMFWPTSTLPNTQKVHASSPCDVPVLLPYTGASTSKKLSFARCVAAQCAHVSSSYAEQQLASSAPVGS